jgi:pyruvate-ferredoxin/flavodoxin oxidoreductase
MAEGDAALPADLLDTAADGGESAADGAASDGAAGGEGGDYMAPWIDTDECTACDECTNLNSAMFAYNDSKKAFIKDPQAGPYRDLVKAAEKCTAQVIHPGLPADRGEADIDKWISRGEKYN